MAFSTEKKSPFDVVFNCLLEWLAKNEGCLVEKQNKKNYRRISRPNNTRIVLMMRIFFFVLW